MAQVTLAFAGRVVEIHGPEQVVRLARGAFRHHACVPAPPHAVLRCADRASERPPGTARRDGNVWSWTVPDDSVRGDADWFFYYGFARVMHQIWDGLGLVRLHGALACRDGADGILVVGDRRDGKSTLAAGWLDQGGGLATDDTVLVDPGGPTPLAYGVLRELHLDPGLAPLLARLDGVGTAEPYLPGRSRVRYDWVSRFPELVRRDAVTVRAAIRSRVDAGRPTTARRLAGPDRAEIVRAAAEGDRPGRLATVEPWLCQLPAWEVRWGSDLWTMPGRHVAYLDSLLSEVG